LHFIAWLVFPSGRDQPDLASLVPQPLNLCVFKSGRPDSERLGLPPVQDHERLSSCLAHHQCGWHPSLVKSEPGMLVPGTNFMMNIQHSSVINNAVGKQIGRKADDADFQFLLPAP